MNSIDELVNELKRKTGRECVFQRIESNVRSYCRSFPKVLDKAEGPIVWDNSGVRYIDFFSGAGALNYGHNPAKIKERLIDYLNGNGISHSLDFHTEAKKAFLESFEHNVLIPRGMNYKLMFPGPTGTNAVESALKVARLATGRDKIAAFTNGFHGMTLGSLAATGSKYCRSGAGSRLEGVDRYPFDGYFGSSIDTLELIDKLISDPSSGYEAPAAFLVETIQAEGGVLVASPRWIEGLGRLARKHGSLLIIDDIQVGCGRTGNFFSFEDMKVEPDIICLSKSISGYGQPMSLVLISPEHDVLLPGQHNGTFRGNNLAFVAAQQASEFWSDPEFVRSVATNVTIIRSALENIHRNSGPGFLIRGRGMIQALLCPSPESASNITQDALKRGLILETCGPRGEVIKLLPPINIDPDVLLEGMDILERCVSESEGLTETLAAC